MSVHDIPRLRLKGEFTVGDRDMCFVADGEA